MKYFRAVTPSEILEVVASVSGVTMSEMAMVGWNTQRRAARIAYAYLARKLTHYGYPSIAAAAGSSAHSSFVERYHHGCYLVGVSDDGAVDQLCPADRKAVEWIRLSETIIADLRTRRREGT